MDAPHLLPPWSRRRDRSVLVALLCAIALVAGACGSDAGEGESGRSRSPESQSPATSDPGLPTSEPELPTTEPTQPEVACNEVRLGNADTPDRAPDAGGDIDRDVDPDSTEPADTESFEEPAIAPDFDPPVGGERITPTDCAIDNSQPVDLTELRLDPENEAVILASFTGGILECYAYAAEVGYDDDVVSVGVIGGSRADLDGDVGCIDLAVFYTMEIPLDEPLNGRPLQAFGGNGGPIGGQGVWERIDNTPDINERQPQPITELTSDVDDERVLVRFDGAAYPCSSYHATVTETAAKVLVKLESGLTDDAAVITCIAAILSYEIELQLAEPLGDRLLVIDPASS